MMLSAWARRAPRDGAGVVVVVVGLVDVVVVVVDVVDELDVDDDAELCVEVDDSVVVVDDDVAVSSSPSLSVDVVAGPPFGVWAGLGRNPIRGADLMLLAGSPRSDPRVAQGGVETSLLSVVGQSCITRARMATAPNAVPAKATGSCRSRLTRSGRRCDLVDASLGGATPPCVPLAARGWADDWALMATFEGSSWG